MRKVLPIIVVFVVLALVVWAGLRKPATTPLGGTPPPNSGNVTPSPPVGAAPVVPRPSDAAVAAVMDEMLAAWDKVPTVFAKMETKMPEAAGHPGKTKGEGKYWLQKKNGKVLIHFDLFNELQIKQDDGATLVTGERLITVVDGEHMYSFINQPSHKQAVKKKLNYDDVLQIAGPYLFLELVSRNKLSLLPEEMKDNRATKVIKAQPTDGSRETINYFDKATGIRLEMTELDAKGQTTLQIKLSEIDTNPAISEDRFKFVVPEGVKLEDESNSP